ncbi:hypothetical protein C9374_003241 [Naegleria lovaniensis]|uniref:Uncharacterized protein n=1 Tax=Naegleria lovaniensis TaxID=51637 RepID=A0AA88GNL5_NAELO|nr:uncharacterized protein C9374_003241 [Naegleria lovaniensis]KAG2385426.1 hypothetical protein C9374_003241 [Naegleria lovaniensis]
MTTNDPHHQEQSVVDGPPPQQVPKKRKGKKIKKPFRQRVKIGWGKTERKDKINYGITMGLSIASALCNFIICIWAFAVFGVTKADSHRIGNTKACLFTYVNNIFATLAVMELASGLISAAHVGSFIFEIVWYASKIKEKGSPISTTVLLGKGLLSLIMLLAFITYCVYAFSLSCPSTDLIPGFQAITISFAVGYAVFWVLGTVLGFLTFHFNYNLVQYLKEAIVGDDDDDESDEEEDEDAIMEEEMKKQ